MSGPRPNVALVVLDTLRLDYFERYFDWLAGRRFTNAYSTANWTIPAHASLFTGRYPSEVGVHSKSPTLDDWETALPAVLQENGYRTSMYTANPNLTGRSGWDEGFDVVRGPDEFDVLSESDTVDWDDVVSTVDVSSPQFYREVLAELAGTVGSGRSTYRSLKQGLRRVFEAHEDGGARALVDALAESTFEDGGEFLFVNLMDCHVPYVPPAEYRTNAGATRTNNWEPFVDGLSDAEAIRTGYRDSVRYLSEAFQPSFDALRETFDCVLVTSDHGELLGEHGMIDHLYGLYPELTRVPLVLWGRDVDEGRVDVPVSLLDVYATVLDVAGIQNENRGRSLRAPDLQRSAAASLTEYQGFPAGTRETFLENGVPEGRYVERDAPLFGCVTEAGTYVYETHDDGVQVAGAADASNEDALERLVSASPVHAVERVEDVEIPDGLRGRLEDLGYA